MKTRNTRPPSEHEIVRRSDVTRGLARGRPRAVVRRLDGVVVLESDGPLVRLGRRTARLMRPAVPRFAHTGRLVRIAAVAAVMTGIGALGAWAWQSTAMAVKEVRVEGALAVQADQVAIESGLRGRHMVTADLGAVSAQLRQHPLIKDARIEREWPNTMVIKIEERTRWGAWEQAGVRYAIDRDGMVLGTFHVPPRSPHIISAEPTTLKAGDRVSYQAVDAVAELYERLPQTVGVEVAQVAFVPSRGVEVITTDGRKALLGDSSSIAYKLAVWGATDKEADRLQIAYQQIDLRWGNRPVLQ